MFRKLTTNDKDSLYQFLDEERPFNLFIYGDVENYGFETDFQELWAQFEDDRYIAVLLRYKNFVIVYAKGAFDTVWFAEKIKSYHGIEGISGRQEIIDAIKDLIPHKKIRKQLLAELKSSDDIPENYLNAEVSVAVPEHAKELFELEEMITEFDDFSTSIEKVEEAIRSGRSKTYLIKEGEKIVSCASTTAETKDTVMVIGVCTHSKFRGKGYASLCTAKLSYDMLKAGKTPCLFYDNPDAGKIYRKIGYKEIGRWDLIVL